MVTMLIDRVHQVTFASFKAVDIVGTRTGERIANHEQIRSELGRLAKETNSLIARRIVEPQENGKTIYTYEAYGQGKLSKDLKLTNLSSRETSDLISSYLMVEGQLNS